MVILALETATRAGSLAVRTDSGLAAAMTGDPERTHGVRLPGEIARVLLDAGLALPAVEAFAVVTGPGSFTGLRVGLATIQGLALANARRVIGVPTLEALAAGWIDARPAAQERLVTCLDAARGDVFYAAYDVAGVDRIEAARVVVEPRVAPPAAAGRDLAAACGDGPVTIVGDGAERYGSVLRAQLPRAIIGAPMPNLAAAAARLAARRLDQAQPPHALRPVYIRRPDAELARARAGRDGPAAAKAGPDADAGRPPGLTIFEVTDAADLARVAALQALEFGAAWDGQALAGDRAGNYAPRLFAARSASGELVGYCAGWIIADELHINSLAVHPRYRNQGVGRALLQHVLADVAAGGVRSATLEVRASNRAGRGLYERLGFRVEGTRRGYYDNPPDDALLLWRRGLSADGK